MAKKKVSVEISHELWEKAKEYDIEIEEAVREKVEKVRRSEKRS